MKIRIIKELFAIAFVLLLLTHVTSGETSPFKLSVVPLKERVPAGDIVPVAISISIAPNHHIYRDQLNIEGTGTAPFTIATTEIPAGRVKYDPFLEKETEIYEGQVEAKLFLQTASNTSPGTYNIKLRVSYQGCSDKICFAPRSEEFILPLEVESAIWGATMPEGKGKPVHTVSKPIKEPDTDGFQKTIKSRGMFVSLILVFLAGVGLSFTPCVYPIIPITVAVIGGQTAGDQSAARKPLAAFFLSLIYVLGISIVYAAMGVAAASTGALFGTALQSPWLVGFVVAVFFGLALSMFGVYTLRLPSFISDRLGTKTGRGFIGVFVMGLISGTVVSPCIGPVLASLLVYIASTGNKFLGFWMLFIFAWGLGLLLIVLGTFSGTIKTLPRSGRWMETVERVFGLLLIGAALYYLRLIIPEGAFVIILGLFLIVIAVFSGGFDRLTRESANFHRTKKAFGIIAFIFGVYLLAGHLMIRGFILPPLLSTDITKTTVTSEEIDWVLNEKEGLKQAREEGRVAMIDFWASWCAACMELEKLTYTDADVIRELRRFVNIKIDCTNTKDANIKQLWQEYGIVGLPTIVFIDRDGTVMKDKTITGFIHAKEFLRILKGLE